MGLNNTIRTIADDFRIRASACGQIMTDPKTKSAKDAGELSETAKNYCEQWVKEQLYSRHKEFSSKYTTKGNECEAASIDFASEHFGWGLVAKNEQHYTDAELTGTPDIVLAESVEDIKNSWDCFTFPLLDTNPPEKKYYWQGQVYMALTDRNSFGLVYTLMNAPDHLIEQEARRQAGFEEVEAELYDAVRSNMVYDHLPAKLRIKRFAIARDDEAIASIRDRVLQCREYIRKLASQL